MLEIAKAIKGGQLDTDKIEGFKSLVENYRPNIPPTNEEIYKYIDGLFEFGNFIPTEKKAWIELTTQDLPDEEKSKCKEIFDGKGNFERMYDELVKDAFWGTCAMLALGGKWLRKERDTSIMEDFKKLRK